MTQTPMYQGQADSPDYIVASPGIGSGDTTIPFNSLSGILAGPGLITLRLSDADTTPETIYYPSNAVQGSSLVGVTRGFGGTTAKAFPAGSLGCRAHTAYDQNTFILNINDLVSSLAGKQATLTNPVIGLTASFISGDVITGTGTGNTVQDSGVLLSNLVLTSDSRMTNARTPTAHESTHITGGSDVIPVATSTSTGLLPILANTGTKYLRDDGTWQTAGGGSGTVTSVASGNGMNFITITGSGTVTMGTPSSITASSTNSTSATSHTHAIDSTIFTASNGKSVTTPIIDGTAVIGSTNTWADGAHVHPTDTSRLSATSSGSGYLWIGTSGNGFSNAQLTQGTGITITNASGSITVANPWGAAPGSPAQGMILYYNGSGWVGLAAGTSGYVLQTQGAGANPQWVAGGSSGTVTSVAAGNGMNFTTITGTGSVTMGTPGSITSSSTNATTTNSHTHAIDSTIFTASNGKSSTTPVIDGTATIGTTNTWADGGHIHPTDTSRAPNPFHDYEVVMAQRWTVYTPKSMGGTDAEFITEVLSTSGIERTYLGYTNGITQHAYLEIEMPDDWDGGNVDFRFNWETTSASANTCIMQLWGLRTATGGTSDAALTQLASVTSTNAGAGLRNVSSFSSNFTISGSGNHLSLMFTRSTGDTLAAAVKILSVTLKYIRTVA
jgi:hypothetical protein